MADVLTPKRERFCEEYLVDLCGAEAAVRAGYARSGAKQEAYRLMAMPVVQERIAELQAARSDRTAITADRVLEEAGRIGFAKITDLVRWGVKEVAIGFDADGKRLAPQDIGDAVMVHHELAPFLEPINSDELPEHVKAAVSEVALTKDGLKLKLHGKVEALNLAARHLGMFVDRHEVTGAGGKPLVADEATTAARVAALIAAAKARRDGEADDGDAAS